MTPDVKKGEWADLINGIYNSKLTSITLKMKLSTLKINVIIHKISMDEAVLELHRFISVVRMK